MADTVLWTSALRWRFQVTLPVLCWRRFACRCVSVCVQRWDCRCDTANLACPGYVWNSDFNKALLSMYFSYILQGLKVLLLVGSTCDLCSCWSCTKARSNSCHISLWRLWEHHCNAGRLRTDLDPVVDEAPAVPSWSQMRVFLSAGHLDAPHRLPGLVELAVNRVNPRVVRSHCVAHICGDTVLLERGQDEGRGPARR